MQEIGKRPCVRLGQYAGALVVAGLCLLLPCLHHVDEVLLFVDARLPVDFLDVRPCCVLGYVQVASNNSERSSACEKNQNFAFPRREAVGLRYGMTGFLKRRRIGLLGGGVSSLAFFCSSIPRALSGSTRNAVIARNVVAMMATPAVSMEPFCNDGAIANCPTAYPPAIPANVQPIPMPNARYADCPFRWAMPLKSTHDRRSKSSYPMQTRAIDTEACWS